LRGSKSYCGWAACKGKHAGIANRFRQDRHRSDLADAAVAADDRLRGSGENRTVRAIDKDLRRERAVLLEQAADHRHESSHEGR